MMGSTVHKHMGRAVAHNRQGSGAGWMGRETQNNPPIIIPAACGPQSGSKPHGLPLDTEARSMTTQTAHHSTTHYSQLPVIC